MKNHGCPKQRAHSFAGCLGQLCYEIEAPLAACCLPPPSADCLPVYPGFISAFEGNHDFHGLVFLGFDNLVGLGIILELDRMGDQGIKFNPPGASQLN